MALWICSQPPNGLALGGRVLGAEEGFADSDPAAKSWGAVRRASAQTLGSLRSRAKDSVACDGLPNRRFAPSIGSVEGAFQREVGTFFLGRAA